MTKKKTSKQDQARTSAGFDLGGLFEGIQGLVEAAERLKKTGQAQGTHEFQVPGLGEQGKGILGFSIRTLSGQQGSGVEVRPFGNIHNTGQGMAVQETREAVVDLFEEDQQVRLVAELPGCSKDRIRYEVKGDVLRIWTEDDRRYDAEVLLPVSVDAQTVESTYNNGIFEMRFEKSG